MAGAGAYRALEKLRNGEIVTLRAISADDKERVLKAFHALEAQSIYTRFFSMKRELSAEDLRRLTEIDPARDMALVATIDGETLIAGGRYVSGGGPSAEVAFTVEEDYQKLGLATRLLRHLVRIARGRGIEAFEAYVLDGNAAMLGVFERSGLPMRTKREDGQIHVTLDLRGPEGGARPARPPR